MLKVLFSRKHFASMLLRSETCHSHHDRRVHNGSGFRKGSLADHRFHIVTSIPNTEQFAFAKLGI